MSVDTSGLFSWPSPDAVAAAAPGLGSSGQAYCRRVEGAAAVWAQLNADYSGAGAGELQEAFGTVTPHARLLAQTADQASGVLAEFAEGIRALMVQRDALMAEIHSARREAQEGAEGSSAGPGGLLPSSDLLLRNVADKAMVLDRSYTLLEDETAARLKAVVQGEDTYVNLVTDLPGAVAATAAGHLAKIPSSRQTVVKVPTPVPLYIRYETPGERIRHMTRGRWLRDGQWKLISVNVLALRPRANPLLYQNSTAYRNRVDANSSKWAPPSGGWRNLTRTAMGFKLGGGMLAPVTAAFTVADERQDAYNELLQRHPGMDPEELEERANAMGAVKGGTKAGLDLAAAGAGALIGSSIGGPAGALVGAGIGLGLSAVTSIRFEGLGGRTIKDALADSVMGAVDGLMESDLMDSDAGRAVRQGTDAAVEAAAHCWKRLFGS
ncbi:hypothetical protein ABIB35_000076 [Arthrobacter sp. UYP6]|uniref:hypothetical protein n=1 Tax=Arthrobacter sp. UYP6 TaxID=1756378 RepID=UPI0033954659